MAMPIKRLIKSLLGNSKPQQATEPSAGLAHATIIPRNEHCISRSDMSSNALKVLYRLHKEGFEAYLVGGSVRDLMLRHAPKDFDIATNATPEQVRKLFRNCRLIGRRFRLAHILFGREIIEVATFRASHPENYKEQHQSEHGILLRDNVYGGTIEDDAIRRDFTVNALYYNIADFSVVDFTDGVDDLKNRQIRMIGDPATRIQEDPVRMLRAIRFAAKLDFDIQPDLAAAIKQLADTITLTSSSRLFEEIIKLFHGGYAVRVFELLQEFNLFTPLFPKTDNALSDNYKSLLSTAFGNTDKRRKKSQPVTPAFLFAVLLWPALRTATHQNENEGMPPLPALELAMSQVIPEQNKITAIPKRFTQVVRQIWLLQYFLPRRAGKRAFRSLSHPRFRAAYDFLLVRGAVGEVEQSLCDWWTTFHTASPDEQNDMVDALQQSSGQKRRRSRKKS
jgi:poly(A) polymerase